ncbi:MmcQ/YjbR family DNA-binding protein [Micromonospora rifamycinica]|uniref:MmcQ/YjbR family DNA-binding protein n=1 Tax=Micromonospora rifamycinica TaxID=291594 RepID=UPI003434BB36
MTPSIDNEESAVVSHETVSSIALSLPGAHQSAHFDVTDFRVNNKIFCTLPKPGVMGMRIDVAEQAALIHQDPATFSAPNNKYGQSGWTFVELATVDPTQLQELITDAWRRLASRKLQAELDEAGS